MSIDGNKSISNVTLNYITFVIHWISIVIPNSESEQVHWHQEFIQQAPFIG